ncbi:MAG: hypothetical protein FWH12_03115 [Treponema sp.]|nr:hypothetical protein [Treponema sp.]
MKKTMGMGASALAFIASLCFALSLTILLVHGGTGAAGIFFYLSSILSSLSFSILVYAFMIASRYEDRALSVLSFIISLIHLINMILFFHLQYSDFVLYLFPVERLFLSDYLHFSFFTDTFFFGYLLISFALVFLGPTLHPQTRTQRVLRVFMYGHFLFGFLVLFSFFYLPGKEGFKDMTKAALIIMIGQCLYSMILWVLALDYFRTKPLGKELL